MIPFEETLGLTRQTTILAFQIGDGISILVSPNLGGLIAMCRVSLDRWLRFIFPMVLVLLALALMALIVAVATGYD